jgi:hypothetical protein
MTFSWFAWGYRNWRAALEYLRSLAAWQRLLRWYRTVRVWIERQRTAVRRPRPRKWDH